MVIVGLYYCPRMCLHSSRNRLVLQFTIFCLVSAAKKPSSRTRDSEISKTFPPVVPSSPYKGAIGPSLCPLGSVGASFKRLIDASVDD